MVFERDDFFSMYGEVPSHYAQPDYLEDLLTLLKDYPEQEMRESGLGAAIVRKHWVDEKIVKTIIKIGDPKVAPELLEIARNNTGIVCLWDCVSEALGRFGYRPAIPDIRRYLSSVAMEGNDGREAVIALGQLNDRDSLNLLVQIACNVHTNKGCQAARACRIIDADAATELFAAAFEKCQKKLEIDLTLVQLVTCLRIVGTPKACKLANRSKLEKALSLRPWLKFSEGIPVRSEFLKNYDDDS